MITCGYLDAIQPLTRRGKLLALGYITHFECRPNKQAPIPTCISIGIVSQQFAVKAIAARLQGIAAHRTDSGLMPKGYRLELSTPGYVGIPDL